MPYTFDTDRFTDVRAVIGLDTDVGNLPDETLALPVYQGRTETYINEQLASLSDQQITDNKDKIDIAAVLYLASLVTPSVRAVIAENVVGGFIKYAQVDLEAIATNLRNQATIAVGEILEDIGLPVPSASANINVFTVARSRRTW